MGRDRTPAVCPLGHAISNSIDYALFHAETPIFHPKIQARKDANCCPRLSETMQTGSQDECQGELGLIHVLH